MPLMLVDLCLEGDFDYLPRVSDETSGKRSIGTTQILTINAIKN